ncbi:MAG TPA: hypothetical protein VN683_12575 [Acidothermaceae bacterium]|nr:hypothetical protein [Acidothermaceae bacterium]
MPSVSAFSSPLALLWRLPEISMSNDTNLPRAQLLNSKEITMRDLFFILLTLAIFAVFALIARGAEKL